jgi:oligopeptidase A
MSDEPALLAYSACLKEIDEELCSMSRRLQELISLPIPTPDAPKEIAIIYSNVVHIFVYLEGNHRHLSYEPLMRHREEFFNNREQDEKVLKLLSSLHCSDPQFDADRHRWVIWFRERLYSSDSSVDQQSESLYAAAQRVLHEIDENQAALLQRLGVRTGRTNAATVFYRTVSITESSATRSKLVQAWHRVRDRRLNSLTEIIDGVIAERRIQARKKGFSTIVEETFQRCSVSERRAGEFIRSYLVQSLSSHSKLAANVREATGCLDNPMDHFGYYLRTLLKGADLPLFALDTCLDYLFLVAHRVFGITVTRHANDNPDSIMITVQVENTKVGTIKFDLLNIGFSQAMTVSSTSSRKDPTEKGIYPVGHVLCRFQHGANGINCITFESAHSLFHEFGHAVNHLLIRKRLPNRSGLEYLPLERLENLSMWFEKWVYHSQFAESLSLTPEEREGLTLCQRIKALEFLSTNLESAVTAALDFEVHRCLEGGLEQSFRRLDEEFTLADHIPFSRLPHYFTAPMFRANPGAGFVYVWGAVDSVQKFVPLTQHSVDNVMPNHQAFQAMFGSYFDPSEPSTEPDIETVFDFYGAAIWK